VPSLAPIPASTHSIGLHTLIDGRYLVGRELGRGAMGVVYLARDGGLDRAVAIKMIDPTLVREREVIALFRREATALARVRSENVVQIYSFGTHEGSPFFVMEYVEGANLEDAIVACRSSGAPIPIHRAATILDRCAGGLSVVHALGLVHRDVKPSNVVVESGTGRPVLIDFGLANARGEVQAGLGTPPYMAPELWTDPQQATPASDVYALGVTAFELLTGSAPYDGSTVQELMCMHVDAPIPRASARRPAVAALDGVLSRALAKAPGDRYPNAIAFQRDLESAARALLPESAPFGPTSPSLSGGYAVDALVVDDDEAFRDFAARAIQIAAAGLSLRVRRVASGQEAVAAARDAMPDLVLLDFDMPGLNGLETLSYLRALPGGLGARVMVATGSVERIGRCQFDLLGVNDFVAKPVQIRDLARLLATMIRRD
jgi:eukaryotic-like serine/threonine-protein kinase